MFCDRQVRLVGVLAAFVTAAFFFYIVPRNRRPFKEPMLTVNSAKTTTTTTTTVSHETLKQPQIRYSDGGILDTRLVVDASSVVAFEGGLSFRAPLYENSYPGPTLVIHQGETLRIHLVNNLKDNLQKAPHKMNTFRYPNSTILHVHGLHVSPKGHGDNMFHVVRPGQSWTYEYHLPLDHPAGTYYYHPHFHGSSTLQTLAGMAGAIVVLPSREAATERASAVRSAFETEDVVMMLQQVSIGRGRDMPTIGTISRWNMPLDIQRPDRAIRDDQDDGAVVSIVEQTNFFAVNGEFRPNFDIVVDAPPKRWRIVHAGSGSLLILALALDAKDGVAIQCDWSVLARDGVTFPGRPRKMKKLLLGPGSRADVTVSCRTTDHAALRLPSSPGRRAARLELLAVHPSEAMLDYLGPNSKVFEGLLAVANVVVVRQQHTIGENEMTPSTRTTTVETKNLYSRHGISLLPPPKRDAFDFEWSSGAKRAVDGYLYTQWGVNGVQYEGETFVQRRVFLGEVEEWMIRSGSLKSQHVFHLHVHHFQIIETSHANDMDYRVGDWRDTITIPANGYVVIRWIPDSYEGPSLAHCHLFPHSDTGMVIVFDAEAKRETSHGAHA